MQAILYSIAPFDSTIGSTIKFSWSGNQAFKNRCIIRNNDTNQVVYDNTIDSLKFEHPIDLTKATMVNGIKYNAYITVFDQLGEESDLQPIGTPFFCLRTPVFEFTNISNGDSISSSTFNFLLTYEQDNGELLDSWAISIYSRTYSLLATSGVSYETEEMAYTFSGFDNRNDYYIRAVGQTLNGFSVDTGYIAISVGYNTKEIFSLLDPINLKQEGAIYIQCNIITSEGHTLNPPVFIDHEYLDLRDNQVTYSEGFVLSSNFSLVIVFYDAPPNTTVAYLSDADDKYLATVTYRIGRFSQTVSEFQARYELIIKSNGISSVHYSNIIDIPDNNDKIGVHIYRSAGLYEIEIANLGKVVTE